MSDECLVRLIPDLPAENDAFGPHQRLADAIAGLLVQEDGGRAISLEGAWGSGKSTIVYLLRDALKSAAERAHDRNASNIFVFDAWAHQGDPLRRSFLEQLIDFLAEEAWVDSAKWAKRKALLAKRLRVVETEDSPQLTYGGIWLALTALVVPACVGLLSAAQHVRLITLFIAGALSLSPLIVALILWRTSLGERAAKVPVDAKGHNVFSLLVSRSVTRTRSEAYETPDPTSLEFQAAFNELLAEALDKEPERRLILVIDNLDRVEPTDALAIWASMGGVPSRVEKRNGAFFRLVKCTTNRPPWQAATGGMRHGQRYQEAGRHA